MGVNRESEITVEAWEGDEYVICLRGRHIGRTLHKGDAHVVKGWLVSALEDIEAPQEVKDGSV